MPELAKAYVQIIPSADGIKGNLSTIMDSEAESAGQSSGSKFSSAFGSVAKVGLASIGALASATIAAGGALVKGASDVAAYGDNIDKMSQKMGLSAQAYQEWDAVMRHSGTSIESMQNSMKTLANAVENGNGAFERIGLSMDDIASMSNEDLFSATITALQGVENETERTYLAGQLLGRGATELGALLNTSAEDTQAMKDRVHELGGVLSDEAVANAAAFQDSLQDMQTAFGGLKNSLMSEFMPGLTDVMDGLTNIFAGDSENGLGQVSAGIQSVVDTISTALPEFMSIGSSIVVSLANAITSNLPTLISTGAEALITISTGLIEQLPELVRTGFDIVVSLANSIASALPELIPVAIDAILELVNTLTDPGNLNSLIESALAIIMALANGLISALPQLLAQAPVIISNLVTAVVQAAPQLLSAALELVVTLASGIIDNLGQIFSAAGEIVSTVWDGVTSLVSTIWDIGSNIVEGIWQGISNGFEWIKGKISGWITDVLDFFKSMLGIASPSKVFSGYGLMLAEGLGLGIEDGIGDVESAMGDMSDAAIAAWKADQLSTSLTGTAAYQFSGPNAAMLGGASESADIMSAIFAVGNMIVEAVNNQDSGVYLDGAAVAESLYQHNQDVQLRHGATMII
jgi:phage-related protein